MEKKISFGFSKVIKKSNIVPNKVTQNSENSKIELIKCLEGQSIQLVEERVEEAPLVIPLKDNRKTSAALLSLRTRQAVLNGEDATIQQQTEEKPKERVLLQTTMSHDLEARAARELLAEVNNQETDEGNTSTLVLPVSADSLPLDGAKESTMDDYDSIPITQFGLAMLRGMGWKDEPKKKNGPVDEGPMLRPKGMGLGADKALKPKALLVAPEANETLEIKKGAYVRVLGGKHKDLYGQIEGLDDHAGRVIVRMALGSAKESFNEFMVQSVSKKEYQQYSKCINSAKYDEYKRKENEHGQPIKQEQTHRHEYVDRNESYDRKYHKSSSSLVKTESQSRSQDARDDHLDRIRSSKHRTSRTTARNHRSKSDDSLSSNESAYRLKHKKSKSKKNKKTKSQSHERRNSVHSSSENEKRHKKKTKKSKRSRSRSRSKCKR